MIFVHATRSPHDEKLPGPGESYVLLLAIASFDYKYRGAHDTAFTGVSPHRQGHYK